LPNPSLRRARPQDQKNIAGIEAAILKDSSNAVIESTNTKIRVLHRMALDFANPST
jgi:transposase